MDQDAGRRTVRNDLVAVVAVLGIAVRCLFPRRGCWT